MSPSLIYSPLRYLLICSLALLTWTSCKTTAPEPAPVAALATPHSKTPLSDSDKDFIADFAKRANQTHLVFGCKVYSIDGTTLSFFFMGRNCIFEDNGELLLIRRQETLSLDNIQKVNWIKKGTHFHHVFKKSQFRDEILTIASEYLSMPEWPSVRFDELVVMDRKGKILKNFKFSKYDQTNPFPRPPPDDSWSTEKKGAKEFTHGNSFSELWANKNGKKIHTGYLFYGAQEASIYLLNKSLDKVTAKIPVPERHLHSVQQFNEKQFIAYGNSGGRNGAGGILLIDMKTGAVQEIHKFTDKRQGTIACSSVQILPDNLLFIAHSNCGDTTAKTTFAEYLDLKTGKSVIQQIDLDYPDIFGQMVNLTSFLEKNYSH